MAWRLAFAGAPSFGATILRHLLASEHRVDLVYTQPDRRAGRGRKLRPSAVRQTAEAAGIEVRTPTRLGDEARTLHGFDWLIVAAYGLLLPKAVLNAPQHHCLNVHASLLPRWRGAAPVERAIMAGEARTGVSIMRVIAKLDAGPVYRQRALCLGEDDTGFQATEKLAELGAATLLEVLAELPALAATPQDERAATYADKLAPNDAVIDWRRSATHIARQVRALSGRLTAHTTLADGTRLRVLSALPSSANSTGPLGTLQRRANSWRVVCGEGALELLTVQLDRGKGTAQPMPSVVNGYPQLLYDGVRLGERPANQAARHRQSR